MPIRPEAKPTRLAGTEIRVHDDDGSLTVRLPGGELVGLNTTAAALWALCDGDTSVREIVGAATTLFAGSPDSIERDILATLDELEHQGLLRS